MQKEKALTVEAKKRFREHGKYSIADWCNYAVVMLGFWLLFTAFSSDYRSSALFLSDTVSSAALIIAGLASFKMSWCRWIVAITGTWLLFAPLFLWAPTSVSYTIDSLVGTLAIVLSFVIPGIPGMRRDVESGEEIPPGWSYNPSAWDQRVPLISLAMIGFFLARYLAAYQLGHVDNSWDPFFGNSTERVLTSEVSRAFPVSDAGLGALSYLIDAVAGAIGGTRRWRTMPWMVLLFGFLVIPPGVVSIVLVILQPVSVGAWCSICLFASIVMLIMVPMTVDEVIATFQYLGRARKAGLPFWSTVFRGGEEPSDEPPLHMENLPSDEKTQSPPAIPFNLVGCSLLGAWLMFSPAIIKAQSIALNNYYFTGALVVTVSFIAFAQVCRPVRFVNVLLAVWLMAAPFLLPGFTGSSTLNSILCGAALAIMTWRKGAIKDSFESWNRFIV